MFTVLATVVKWAPVDSHCRLTSNDVSSLPPPLVDYFEVNPHISVQPSVF